MRVSFAVPIILLALAWSSSVVGQCTAIESVVQPLCEAVLSGLHRGDYADIARLLHEPSSYAAQRATEDRIIAQRHLQYLGAKFERPSALRPAPEKLDFYKLSVMGGDIAYWQSLPRMGLDSTAIFVADFSEVGSGVVQLTFIRTQASVELRSVEIGLRLDRPGARLLMRQIARGFLEGFLPAGREADIERSLNAMFGPP